MENWSLLTEAFDDTEATIIIGMLKAANIPAERKDSDAFVGVMRVIGGQAYGIHIYVPDEYLNKAKELLRNSELKDDFD